MVDERNYRLSRRAARTRKGRPLHCPSQSGEPSRRHVVPGSLINRGSSDDDPKIVDQFRMAVRQMTAKSAPGKLLATQPAADPGSATLRTSPQASGRLLSQRARNLNHRAPPSQAAALERACRDRAFSSSFIARRLSSSGVMPSSRCSRASSVFGSPASFVQGPDEFENQPAPSGVKASETRHQSIFLA